ncbi:MAG: class I SAM-dependent methyltransferase [Planctomycetes bacterium]|nr:class I SAM-dependent methyltransferase [Planctomycetota bacterium]
MRSAWDRRARFYDVCEGASRRHVPSKQALFADMRGRVLVVAVGTGADVRCFPPGLEITAIDISPAMLRRAEGRARAYRGKITLEEGDAMNLRFAADSFDTVVTSCTMCSVPDPVRGLRELHRVLRPDGRLLMFEHVRSRNRLLGCMLDIMTLMTRWGGTEMNRDTIRNAQAAGFTLTSVESVYQDIILAIRGAKRRDGAMDVR